MHRTPIVVVVLAYSRPSRLRLLLEALRRELPATGDIRLFISLDRGPQQESCRSVAERFAWAPAQVTISRQAEHLGLVRHVLRSVSAAATMGDILLLEDDLGIGIGMFQYAVSALATYGHNPRIAGISLYSIGFSEVSRFPFRPLDDGSDTYFVKTPMSWGVAWTTAQWNSFLRWCSARGFRRWHHLVPRLPAALRAWPASSWKKIFAAYMLDTNRYFVIPHRGVATSLGEPGHHVRRRASHVVSPVTVGPCRWRFASFKASRCIYDEYLELEGRCLSLLSRGAVPSDCEVDCFGTKPLARLRGKRVLSARAWDGARPFASFGIRHFPPELNVVLHEPGTSLKLVRGEAVKRALSAETARTYDSFFLPPY